MIIKIFLSNMHLVSSPYSPPRSAKKQQKTGVVSQLQCRNIHHITSHLLPEIEGQCPTPLCSSNIASASHKAHGAQHHVFFFPIRESIMLRFIVSEDLSIYTFDVWVFSRRFDNTLLRIPRHAYTHVYVAILSSRRAMDALHERQKGLRNKP